MKNGRYTLYHHNGEVNSVGNYKNDLLDGSFTIFSPEGKATVVETFKDGVLHGPRASWLDKTYTFFSWGEYDGIQQVGDMTCIYYNRERISGEEYKRLMNYIQEFLSFYIGGNVDLCIMYMIADQKEMRSITF